MTILLVTDSPTEAQRVRLLLEGDGHHVEVAPSGREGLEKLNRALRTTSRCNKVLVRAESEDELLRGVCQTVVEVGGYRMAWVGYAEQDAAQSVRPVAVAGLDDGYVQDLRLSWAAAEQRGIVAAAIRASAPQWVGQIASDPRFTPWRDAALRRGYASAIALPLRTPAATFGVLSIYGADSRAIDPEEVELLTELADDLAFGIQALRTRQAHTRALAEVESLALFPSENPNPVLRVRDDGILLYANPASEPLLRHWRLAVGERVADDLDGAIRRARGSSCAGEQFDVACRERTYSVLAAPVPGAGYTNLYAQDVTDRKRAEEALRLRNQQLEAAQTTAVEIARELDLPTVLRLIARRVSQLTGASLGTVYLWEEPAGVLVPCAWDADREWLREIRMGLGEGVAGTAAQTRRGLLVNDFRRSAYATPWLLEHTRHHAVLSEPLLYGSQLLGVMSVVHDEPGKVFTDQDEGVLAHFASQAAIAIMNARLYEEVRRHAAELEAGVQARTAELKAANDQLRDASRRKSAFLANMSHEIRTPLNSIIGFSELLVTQSVGPLNERQQRFLNNVHKSGQHLLQLIGDILDLSKVEAGKFVLQPEVLAVEQVLDDILVIARGLASKKSQAIETAIPAGLPPLTADPVRLKQILFNLLSNAVKFTPERGTIRVRARVVPGPPGGEPALPATAPSACAAPGGIEIAVADNGVGIRAADLPRLFREFVQLETTRGLRHEGTGLGLALSRRLVELHGGRIWAESAGEGCGSLFAVVLPLTPPPAPVR
jgi:signal transduction histidine kinase/PAS domain-containing protein